MSRLFPILALALMGLGASAAQAAGTAVGVDPQAAAERQNQSTTLVVGADIFIGDRVVTGDSGQVQIRFMDSTELVVGPRSALVIEDYLLRGDGSAGRMAIEALSGTFRFVTGSAPKDRYRITTPTGTIGVRGTAFDFSVAAGAAPATSVLLYEGAVELCATDGNCVVVSQHCAIAQGSSHEAVLVGHADGVTGEARELLRALFPYAQSQRALLRAFRVGDAERCLRRPAGHAVPQSITSSGDGLAGVPGGSPPAEPEGSDADPPPGEPPEDTGPDAPNDPPPDRDNDQPPARTPPIIIPGRTLI